MFGFRLKLLSFLDKINYTYYSFKVFIINTDVNTLLDFLKENEELITKNYHDKQGQVLLDKSLVLKLFSLSKDKSLIESSIKEHLALKETDLILYKKGFIFIKVVKEERRKEITEKERGTAAERYNGISEKELEEFYKEFFEDEERKDFFLHIAKEFVQIFFHTKKISNLDYEKNVFTYIQKIVFKHLIKLYDNSDKEFFRGFSGYLFRQNFKTVFEHLANLLLEEIAISNSVVIEFLNYYASGVIVLGGVKYKVPSIETNDGIALSVVSIISVVKVYFKASHTLFDIHKEIHRVTPELKRLYIANQNPLVFNNSVLKSIQQVEMKIGTKTKKLKNHYDAEAIEKIPNEVLRTQKKKERNSLLVEIKELNNELDKLNTKIVQANVLKQYTSLKSELDSYVRHKKNQEKILSQIDDKFITIRDALVKALVAKKKKV